MEIIFDHFIRTFLLFFILISSYGLGVAVIKISPFKYLYLNISIFQLTSITIGFVVWSYLILIIGLLKVLNIQNILFFLISSSIFGMYHLWNGGLKNILKNLNYLNDIIQNINITSKIILLFLLINIILNILGSLSIPIGVDDIKYHFAIPKRYVEAGEIIYFGDMLPESYPFPIEMLWTLALLLNTAELAQMLNCTIGLLVLLWIIKIGKEFKLKTIMELLYH